VFPNGQVATFSCVPPQPKRTGATSILGATTTTSFSIDFKIANLYNDFMKKNLIYKTSIIAILTLFISCQSKAEKQQIKKEIATLVDNPFHSDSAEKASSLKTILSNKAQTVAKKITQIADAPARRKNGGKTDFSGRRDKSAKTNSRKKFSEKKIGGVLKQKMKRASSKDFQETHGAKKSIWSALKNKAGKFGKR
jgi:hypothetical protein